jgi:murein DD-endopeptidase MepM/ murein hydrolase activator NlpD
MPYKSLFFTTLFSIAALFTFYRNTKTVVEIPNTKEVLHSDTNLPKPQTLTPPAADYFRNPVNFPIFLSGSFGELRADHFHAGIDIKSLTGGVGAPVVAAAEGYVSRIKINANGYGNTLYIAHPNGYTTVYAHLDGFNAALEEYIKANQYAKESFEIDITPPVNLFLYQKGQQVAQLGNTGGSTGPHLHFEVRETESEKACNPLLYGVQMNDNMSPRFYELKIYLMDESRRTISTQKVNLPQRGDGSAYLPQSELVINSDYIGLGVKTYDMMDGNHNKMGPYNIIMMQDEVPIFDYRMTKFDFSETRYVNAQMDFAEQHSMRSYIQRCYVLPGNQLSDAYHIRNNDGIIALDRNKPTKITFIAEDPYKNRSRVEFWVRRSENTPLAATKPYNYVLPYNEENVIQAKNMSLFAPKGALYETLLMNYRTSSDWSSGVYSQVHHLHDANTPLHKFCDLSITPETPIPSGLESKAFIAYCKQGRRYIETCGGEWINGAITAKVRELGDYCVMIDNIAPTITPISFRYNMEKSQRMSFHIKDNFPTAESARDGMKYRATVDGQWILMTFDAKRAMLTHEFDGKIPYGQHTLRLEVTDNRNNVRVFEQQFVR